MTDQSLTDTIKAAMKAIFFIALAVVKITYSIQFLKVFKQYDDVNNLTNSTNNTLDSGCLRYNTLSALKVGAQI